MNAQFKVIDSTAKEVLAEIGIRPPLNYWDVDLLTLGLDSMGLLILLTKLEYRCGLTPKSFESVEPPYTLRALLLD